MYNYKGKTQASILGGITTDAITYIQKHIRTLKNPLKRVGFYDDLLTEVGRQHFFLSFLPPNVGLSTSSGAGFMRPVLDIRGELNVALFHQGLLHFRGEKDFFHHFSHRYRPINFDINIREK